MLSTIPSTQQQHQDRQCCGKQAQVSPKRWVLPSSTQPTSSATAPTCHEPRNVCTEHPVCFGSHTGPGIAPQSCHPQALLLHVGSGKGRGHLGTAKRAGDLSQSFPAAGKGKEGLNRVQMEGEEPDASLATGNHDGLAVTGRAVERSSGHPQHSDLLSASTVTLGCSLALPRPPQCHPPAQGQQEARAGSRGRVPRGAAKGLLGVKPGEFGTAERKSRPVRELGTEPPARSPAAPPWQWPTAPGPCGQSGHGGCVQGGMGGFAYTTQPSSSAKNVK